MSDIRRDCYGAELPPISESDGALYAKVSRLDLIAALRTERDEALDLAAAQKPEHFATVEDFAEAVDLLRQHATLMRTAAKTIQRMTALLRQASPPFAHTQDVTAAWVKGRDEVLKETT